MTTWSDIERYVRTRAGDRCEYCQMHQALQGATFHIEHIVPQSLGGTSRLENLAWSYPGCNLHKAGRVKFTDPASGHVVPLFSPRSDCWYDHFEWRGFKLIALSAVGRATCEALSLNRERRLLIRQAEAMFGLFPPESFTRGRI